MIRCVQLSVNNANIGKQQQLNNFNIEAVRVINANINVLWKRMPPKSKFFCLKIDTWLSARMQQCLGKIALGIVKSQRKHNKKTKPTFKGNSYNLDNRFVDIQFDNNSFDVWIKLSSIGKKIILKLPAKKHRQVNRFVKWKLNKSIRLRCINGKWFVDLYYKKAPPMIKQKGKPKAIDIGYKKLIVSSDKEFIGNNDIYEKISRKKQGSKAFKRALVERNEFINAACKNLDVRNTFILYVEDLKNVKKNSSGKIRKKFNNKLQRWSYPKVLNKLSMLCEEAGILFKKVPPQYTSQRCSACGVIDMSNRKGEIYQCACGNSLDADYNAALNILHLGVYGPQALQPLQG